MVAYRSKTSMSSEGSDHNKLIIKPFSDSMYVMANYLPNLLVNNQGLLHLESVDLSKSFNSCTILIYRSLKDIKSESSMGWHCGSKYSTGGKFKVKRNVQSYNTPVVIFTIGHSRYLSWRIRFTKRSEKGY